MDNILMDLLNGINVEEEKEIVAIAVYDQPTFRQLVDISAKIGEALNDPGVIIFFSGSVVTNLLGLTNKQIKDIDVVLSLPGETLDAQGVFDYEVRIQKALHNSDIIISEDMREGGPGSSVEVLAKIKVTGIKTAPIEVFTDEMRQYLTLYEGGYLINIATIDGMYKKKWEYNKKKTNKHIDEMVSHLKAQSR